MSGNDTGSNEVTEQPNASQSEAMTKSPVRRRRRTSIKTVPRAPVPVRALWEAASGEQQELAHQRATVMLEYWVAVTSKSEAAEKLGVTPLRVWQMSQMAVAGMVCGLLPQPRFRKGQRVTPTDPENDPVLLRKELEKTRRELAVAKQLIDLLKTLPGNAGRQLEPSERRKPELQKKEAGTSRRAGSSGRKRVGRGSGGARKKRSTPPSGGRARGATSSTRGKRTGRGSGDGTDAPGEGADGAPLEEPGGGAAAPEGPTAADS